MSEERKTLEQRATMTDIERLHHSAAHVLATAVACHPEVAAATEGSLNRALNHTNNV